MVNEIMNKIIVSHLLLPGVENTKTCKVSLQAPWQCDATNKENKFCSHQERSFYHVNTTKLSGIMMKIPVITLVHLNRLRHRADYGNSSQSSVLRGSSHGDSSLPSMLMRTRFGAASR